MRLREYTSADLNKLVELDNVCFAAPFRFSGRAMKQFAEARNGLTVIAEEELSERISGFCIAQLERNRSRLVAYVVTIDVDPAFRRRGLGRSLLRETERQALEADCEAMELHVSVENAVAIAFYEDEGYVRGREVRSFYGFGRHAFVYLKRLGEHVEFAAARRI